MKIVLDTHILLRAAADQLSEARKELLEDPRHEIFVSAISLWEITKLYELKRIRLEEDLEKFLMTIENHPRFTLVPLTTTVLAEIPRLGEKTIKDPADQMIVAVARKLEARLMTDDKPIRKSGLVKTI
ncbi:MAG: type II toxin-antitoxin system VapC family toxin [Deltaproteobacteria bacterium]|nr:type II toxin-antitoxin system VapC family toxin [Deltaproteobacteria bacterium]